MLIEFPYTPTLFDEAITNSNELVLSMRVSLFLHYLRHGILLTLHHTSTDTTNLINTLTFGVVPSQWLSYVKSKQQHTVTSRQLLVTECLSIIATIDRQMASTKTKHHSSAKIAIVNGS